MSDRIHTNLFAALFCLALLAVCPVITKAQEADTTKKNVEFGNNRRLSLPDKADRSYTGGMMRKMGTYNVPGETEYYTPPFKGQYYLDLAMEAYRKELEKNGGDGWFWHFLEAVSPYINNQFEFGVYHINDLPVVGRDNPLFKSYHKRNLE